MRPKPYLVDYWSSIHVFWQDKWWFVVSCHQWHSLSELSNWHHWTKRSLMSCLCLVSHFGMNLYKLFQWSRINWHVMCDVMWLEGIQCYVLYLCNLKLSYDSSSPHSLSHGAHVTIACSLFCLWHLLYMQAQIVIVCQCVSDRSSSLPAVNHISRIYQAVMWQQWFSL